MRKVLLLAAVAACVAGSALAGMVTTYPSEEAAQRYCRSDVVWINTNTLIYHKQGSRYYGNTKVGAWACEAGAVRAGAHEAKNEH